MAHSLPRTFRHIINSVFVQDGQNERLNQLIVDVRWTCQVLAIGSGTDFQVL
jgi:hypothetical protein